MECIRYRVMDNRRDILYVYSCKCIHLKRVQVYTGECTLPSPRYRVDLVVECVYILLLKVLFTRARLYYIHLYTLVHVYTPCSVYTLHTVYFYIVQCTMNIARSSLLQCWSVHCTMYNVHCTMYCVQLTLSYADCKLWYAAKREYWIFYWKLFHFYSNFLIIDVATCYHY